MLGSENPNRKTILCTIALLAAFWLLACLVGTPLVIKDDSASFEVTDIRSLPAWRTGCIVTVTNQTDKEVTARRLPYEDEVCFLPGESRSFEVTSPGCIEECGTEGKTSGGEISFRFSDGFFR